MLHWKIYAHKEQLLQSWENGLVGKMLTKQTKEPELKTQSWRQESVTLALGTGEWEWKVEADHWGWVSQLLAQWETPVSKNKVDND